MAFAYDYIKKFARQNKYCLLVGFTAWQIVGGLNDRTTNAIYGKTN